MTELTITEAAEKFQISPDTLRYYERIGLLPAVPRTPSGRRCYPEDVQKWLEMIICLRHSGVGVEKLLDYVSLIQQGDQTLPAQEELLREQRDALVEKQHDLQRSIDRLNHKLKLYETGEIKQHKSYFAEYHVLDD